MRKLFLIFAVALSQLYFAISCYSQVAQPAAVGQKAGEKKFIKIKGVDYTFCWCPAGTFTMGSPDSEDGRGEDEKQHRVTFSEGFVIAETAVTQKQWQTVMGNNPSSFKGDNLPVESVSWDDCQKYIAKLNNLGVAPKGFKFTLPTEAQWEYACRAGTTTLFNTGSAISNNTANYGSGIGKTIKVGSYPPNAWGLYDMHGNVWEWCSDWYGDYSSGTVTDPTGATKGSSRVIRGGCWRSRELRCRSATRGRGAPSSQNRDFGIRLVLVSENK
jgi:formylglycine-generating enzyme required for sulfatase activity